MASRVLQRWLNHGKGEVDHVLILARFLGHTHAKHTYWYLSSMPQLLAKAAQRFGPDFH
jgi:hypothetical protein